MGYFEILEGKQKPRFLRLRGWKRVWRMLSSCRLCERRCGVNRLEGETGFCRVGKDFRIFGCHLHWGEEPELIPSGTVFLAGCTLNCCYCQNAPESIDYRLGMKITFQGFREVLKKLEGEGARNINLVGGDPTPYIPQIFRALSGLKLRIPIIFNSNSYYSAESARVLEKFVDLYLLDFRYWSDSCSERLSQAPGYAKAARRNLIRAKEVGDLLIRVLVLPGHLDCDAKPILEWVRKRLGKQVRINLMSQYRPCWHAHRYPEISRELTPEEWQEIKSYAEDLGFENILYS